jgi:hypothetical protein
VSASPAAPVRAERVRHGWRTVALGAAAAVVVLCALLMTRLPSALALAAAPGTWACGGELQIWATTVPVDFELYVSRDGWWETDDGVHRGTWRLDGGEVEITSGGATNVVPATLGVGASTDQRISHPQGMSMAMQVEAAGIDVVRVRVGTANLLQGDYSCRKVSNGTPAEPSAPSDEPTLEPVRPPGVSASDPVDPLDAPVADLGDPVANVKPDDGGD